SAALQGRNTFGSQLRAAINQTRVFGAILFGAARNGLVVGFVGLPQIGGVGVGNGALVAHPQQSSAGIQSARKSNTDLLAGGDVFKNGRHGRYKALERISTSRAL